MRKTSRQQPRWIANLRLLMEARDLNPRSLSLKAGLNPTAVRDMLEGRTQFPRYDTVEALAASLGVTPAQLMGGKAGDLQKGKLDLDDEDLNLLTEIIARLQELVEEKKQEIGPRDFAAMVTAIYRQMQGTKGPSAKIETLKPRIHDLLTYETLRRRARK